jgi:hypothetical protein
LGIIEGLPEGLGEHAVVDLAADDPLRAGCRVSVHMPANAQGSA